MKQITLIILFSIFCKAFNAQTFSSLLPDSLYTQFFLFDKKKNEIGIFYKNIYDNPELRPNAKYGKGDPYSENYERLRKMLSIDDYDFFQKQSESSVIIKDEGFIGKSNYLFKRKKNRILFKKLKNHPANLRYSVPLFNLEKNLALVYWERRWSFECLEVFILKDGIWKSELSLFCLIE